MNNPNQNALGDILIYVYNSTDIYLRMEKQAESLSRKMAKGITISPERLERSSVVKSIDYQARMMARANGSIIPKRLDARTVAEIRKRISQIVIDTAVCM